MIGTHFDNGCSGKRVPIWPRNACNEKYLHCEAVVGLVKYHAGDLGTRTKSYSVLLLSRKPGPNGDVAVKNHANACLLGEMRITNFIHLLGPPKNMHSLQERLTQAARRRIPIDVERTIPDVRSVVRLAN